MKEKLKVKVWPTGNEGSYVQVLNPDVLFKKEKLEDCLYKVEVVDYQERGGDDMKQIRDHAMKMLVKYKDRVVSGKKFDYSSYAGFIGGSTSIGTLILLLTICPPLAFPVAITQGVVGTFGGIYGGGKIEEKRRKKFGDGLAKTLERFEKIPTSQYVHRTDSELVNIYRAIESSEELTYFSNPDLDDIKKLIEVNGKVEFLSSSARKVYNEKLKLQRQESMLKDVPLFRKIDYQAMWEENPEGFKKYFAELDDVRKEQVLTEVIHERVENTELEEWLSKEYGEMAKKVARKMVEE